MNMLDEWVLGPNYEIVSQIRKIADKNMSILEQVLLIAEPDSLMYPKFPSINLFLSDTYISLPEELSLEFRERLELEKSYEMIDWINLKKLLSDDQNYLEMNNARRAVYHLNEGIKKSADNSQPYEPLIKIILGKIALDDRVNQNFDPVKFARNLDSTANALQTYR